MKITHTIVAPAVVLFVASCSTSVAEITSSSTGEVIADMTAHASSGGSPFDGVVDQESDLDDLVATAWGNGALGLHRGHSTIRNVLEVFLGITHKEMHVFMEDQGLNLAGICRHFGFDPENLIETLTASFAPFVQQGVKNGVIRDDKAARWTERIRTEFRNRVYWEG